MDNKRRFFIPSSEITPESAYLKRREFLEKAGLVGLGAAALSVFGGPKIGRVTSAFAAQGQDDKPNTWEEATGYNNYYEFGTDKEDPKANAGDFQARPWAA